MVLRDSRLNTNRKFTTQTEHGVFEFHTNPSRFILTAELEDLAVEIVVDERLFGDLAIHQISDCLEQSLLKLRESLTLRPVAVTKISDSPEETWNLDSSLEPTTGSTSDTSDVIRIGAGNGE